MREIQCLRMQLLERVQMFERDIHCKTTQVDSSDYCVFLLCLLKNAHNVNNRQ